MANIPFDSLGLQAAVPEATPDDASLACLATLPVGGSARVIRLLLEDDLAAWLRAVGVAEGERVTVLRRAAFGGPIHVRTASGGEFALNRALARSIVTQSTRSTRSTRGE
jgi:ferrous iron transport protein A